MVRPNGLRSKSQQYQLSNIESTSITAYTADQEQKRLITYLKRVVLKQHKKRRIQLIVNGYFHAVIRLLRCAESNLEFASECSTHFCFALKSVISCLGKIAAFILDQYESYLDPDVGLEEFNLAGNWKDFRDLQDCSLLKSNKLLSNLLMNEFKASFYDKNQPEITIRKIKYWQRLSHFISENQINACELEDFDHLEFKLIEMNFNSPSFFKYLTSKFLQKLILIDSQSQKLLQLTIFQKLFNQIPLIKDMVYNPQYDDLSIIVNKWFIQEIKFQSKKAVQTSNTQEVVAQDSCKKPRKTTDKILCNLTVDQLALLFKAADQTKIIVARSLSAIFETIDPYLSTPHREEISDSSLRTKTYSVEERDKQLLLDCIDKLARQIREL